MDIFHGKTENLSVLCETDAQYICEYIQSEKPDIVIIDSIQTMEINELNSSPGSVTQVRESTNLFTRTAKLSNIPVFLVGHVNKDGNIAFEKATLKQYDLAKRIENNLPKAIEFTGDKGIVLQDVASGKNTLDEFIAQFDEQALREIVIGEGFSSPKATYTGTASCFVGITKEWHEKGVPVVTTCDGPSGIRIESDMQATCIPVGALLAAA